MIKSAPFIISSSPSRSINKGLGLVVLLNRLLLLGIGSGLAWVLGGVVATLYANPNPEMPLAVKIVERLKTGRQVASPSLNPSTTNPGDVSEINGGDSQTNKPPTQQLLAQLQQLRGEMQVLRDRTQALETTLGNPRPSEPLEIRLQAIEEQLQAAPMSKANQPSTDFQFHNQTEALKVTLPSDVMFQNENSMLSSGADLILDKVISDLRNYQNAVIRVAVYTDNTSEADDSRALSFQRAMVVEHYLSRALGKHYHLVVIGYGTSRPLVTNDTQANRQRNRRVEIIVNNEP